MRVRYAVLSLGVLLAVAAVAGQQQAPPKAPLVVGFISTQRIFAEAEEVRADMARLQAAQQTRTAELQVKQRAVEALRQQIAATADAAARTKLQQQEQQGRTELEQATTQAQTELQTRQRQIQVDLQTKLKTVLDELLKDRPVQLVVNAETAVVWSVPGTDLTTEVVARLNAKAKGLSSDSSR